jgi:hypothetical protein
MDDQRCPPPASFLALYTDARKRPTESLDWLIERHDLCESLAQQLSPSVRAAMADDGLGLDDVMPRCRQVLEHPGIGLSAAEVSWILSRLSELACLF